MGAAALELIGLLVSATLAVAIGMLLAVSLIDLALGLPPRVSTGHWASWASRPT